MGLGCRFLHGPSQRALCCVPHGCWIPPACRPPGSGQDTATALSDSAVPCPRQTLAASPSVFLPPIRTKRPAPALPGPAAVCASLQREGLGCLFQGKQFSAESLALQGGAACLLLLGQGLHRLIKLPPGVGPRRRGLHIFRSAVNGRAHSFCRSPLRMRPALLESHPGFRFLKAQPVHPVRVEIPRENLQELLRVLGFPVRSVVVQHNRVFCIPAGPVHPHIAFALGGFPWLFQYL